MLRNLIRSRSLLSRFTAITSNGNACRVPLYQAEPVAVELPVASSLSLSHPTVRLFHSSRSCLESVTVKCPPFAESITEGDVRWEKAVGDTVELDEPVAEVETDKTGIPITSPTAGVVEELLVEDGDTVTPGMALLKISTDASAVAAAAPAAEAPKAEAPAPTPAAAVEPPKPAAAIPESLPPVPPVPSKPASQVNVKDIKLPAFAASIPDAPTSDRSESRVKMNRMRQRVGQRLKDSQNVYAMLTTFNEIDMTNIMEFRSKHKDAFLKKHGIKLSFMSAFIKASAYALQQSPAVNGVIDDATNEIIYRDYVDVSIAVATPKGLVVPVLRNVEKMSYLDIERETGNLASKARDGKLAIEDMDGGTFTISNGGVFGSMFGTPIINPPQSAILGMHGIFDRPVAINKKVEIRPMMYIALTYDHRLIDGREAVTFLRKIKEGVEDPMIFQIGM